MEGLFDLHMHSNNSDGRYDPIYLSNYMLQRGVNVIAITDHDYITDIRTAKDVHVTVILGVEVTAYWQNQVIHIVGLNVQNKSTKLLDLLYSNRKLRAERAIKIDVSMHEQGYQGALTYIENELKPQSLGRMHFAQFLYDHNIITNISTAFEKILANTSFMDYPWPHLSEVISAIHADGGMAVLAHPMAYQLELAQLKLLIKDFSEYNGDGIEYISGNTTYKEMLALHKLVKAYNLKASMGSDFHYPRINHDFPSAKYGNWLKDYDAIWRNWSK